MAFFAKKTCDDFLQEIRRHLELIASYPETAPSLNAEKELRSAAQHLINRALQTLKKVDALDQKTALGLQKTLLLAEVESKFERLRYHAQSALMFLPDLEKACAAKLAQQGVQPKKLKRGRMDTYGRMMTADEYKRLEQAGMLESVDPGQLIPAFLAPKSIMEFFLKIDKTAVHNLYSQMGGTGHVDYIVFFKTDVIPTEIGSPRRGRRPAIIEVKFPHGTPAQVIQVRRV